MASVVAAVSSTSTATPNTWAWVDGAGWYLITAIGGPTSLTLQNLDLSSSAAPAAVIASGKRVIYSGSPIDPNLYDVRAYGATPADVGAAVRLALLAAGSNDGGTVYIPPLLNGVHWTWATTVNVNFGGAAHEIILKGAGTNIDVRLSDPTDFVFAANNTLGAIRVDGLVFFGNPAIGADCNSVISIGSCPEASVDHCEFFILRTDTPGGCIVNVGGRTSSIGDCFFAGSSAHTFPNGVIGINSAGLAFLHSVSTADGLKTSSANQAYLLITGANNFVAEACGFDEDAAGQVIINGATLGEVGLVKFSGCLFNTAHVTANILVTGAGGATALVCEDCNMGQFGGSEGNPAVDVTNVRVVSLRRCTFGPDLIANTFAGNHYVRARANVGYVEIVDCIKPYYLDDSFGAPGTVVETRLGATSFYPVSIPGCVAWYRADQSIALNESIIIGSGATYAPVVAGHHLDVHLFDRPDFFVTPFTGAENSQASFLATLSSAPYNSNAAGGQIELRAGVAAHIYSSGDILPSSSADVLASLGLVVGPFSPPTIISWGDSSGLLIPTHNLTNSVGPPPFTRVSPTNGAASVSFLTTQSLFSNAWPAPLPQPYTVVVIGRQTTAATTYAFDSLAANGAGIFGVAAHNAIHLNAGNDVTFTSPDTTKVQCFIAQFSGATSNLAVSTQAPQSPQNAGAGSLTGVTVGQIGGGGSDAGWEIFDVVVYNRKLTLQDRQRLNAYAAAMYGVVIV